jgi:rhamnulokinase
MKAFSLPEKIFPRLVPPATKLGSLLPEIATETRCPPLEVIAGCSHDTAAAVAATPGTGEDWAYLSSGTWSLLGVELKNPLLSEAAREHNFTNEAGFGGTTRFLKNIVGLWILQECRRAWKQDGREIDYPALGGEAEAAEPFRSLINPAAAQFLKPDAMPEKIAAFCRETAQPVPETAGQFTRCIFESLALSYAKTLDELEAVTGKSIARLHIIGGGSQSRLLNQFAASASRRTVIAGPVEATAIGNLLVQAIAMGHLGSLAELRNTVRESVEIEPFEPTEGWDGARRKFANICRGGPA